MCFVFTHRHMQFTFGGMRVRGCSEVKQVYLKKKNFNCKIKHRYGKPYKTNTWLSEL